MNNPQNDAASQFDMFVDTEMARHLADTAKWGKFLAIVGIIGSVALIIAFASGSLMTAEDRDLMADPAAKTGFLIGVTLVLGLLYILPCVMLLRCCINMKNALMTSNQSLLTQAFKQQKNLYMFLGIVTIIFLVLMGIGFLLQGAEERY